MERDSSDRLDDESLWAGTRRTLWSHPWWTAFVSLVLLFGPKLVDEFVVRGYGKKGPEPFLGRLWDAMTPELVSLGLLVLAGLLLVLFVVPLRQRKAARRFARAMMVERDVAQAERDTAYTAQDVAQTRIGVAYAARDDAQRECRRALEQLEVYKRLGRPVGDDE